MTIEQIVTERASVYGPPHQHFRRTIDHLNADGFLRVVPGQEDAIPELIRQGVVRRIVPLDWPAIMINDKKARLCESPDHLDSWHDIAGYAWTATALLKQEREE
jgi:hypothetical protein